MEIEQRLGLYQVFLKLYAYHRNLLDEILQLEKTNSKTFSSVVPRCVTGVIQGKQFYLVANLADGKTRTLLQPQGIWIVGRDRQLAIPIQDRWLSRRHAAIQYIQNQGFYLVDLDSTNGSFVNGEPIHGRCLLKDGDRVRLGSLAFSFFVCCDTQTLDEAPPDILEQLEATPMHPTPATAEQLAVSLPSLKAKISTAEQKEEAASFLQDPPELERLAADSLTTQLSPAQQSEILDRFFSRKIQKSSTSI